MVIVLVLLDPEPVAVRRLTYRLYDSGMTRAIHARCLLDAHWLARGYRSINTFSGSIPSEIGILSNVHDMRVANNLFTGTLPGELSLLATMVSLVLAREYYV